MRPTSDDNRMRKASFEPATENHTITYDEHMKYICFSFLYPHQLWRMITVNLIHMGWFHLLSNLSKQLMYGILLERKYGSVRVITLYWLSEFGASLNSMLSGSRNFGVGSSGAIFGVMLFFIVERFSAMKNNVNHRISILIQLVLLVVLPMTISICQIIILKIDPAHSAHLGGGLVGVLFGIGMFGCPCLYNNEHNSCQTICRRTAFGVLFLYFGISLIIVFRTNAPFLGSFMSTNPS
ncbi:unnamed protein product [Adineta steineri]|uniref:rhomboid protease n=1 Tax=Adineta steineri TaxID=433720 RepID=A0A816ASJ1_9BILA|nr:unnamed protein product [Adineta steineri]CAF1601273.1 unnamed protein product [Adineta steineri]